MQDWIVPAVAGGLALVALVLALAQVRARKRTERELARARTETDELRDRLADLERRLTRAEPPRQPTEFVITDLGSPTTDPGTPSPPVGSALFADLVLRETVVKAASLAYGVRRALDAETRNRVWFEMKREVRRSRKQRKADTREARREWQARQRAGLDGEGSAA
ncbi:hypothetical protein GON03_01885 [Nocardioides sp. MAH-18]|uniref:Uncharacterized protein n=1 Tax=Nocardioides agri TaxID=2682843 RepID=A0A6L6XQN7_9ACTN|nr:MULTISPECIES: hypothetical protein [unclassified Nocardioides]MBA2953045.1 hypothetical protein [Nocardioides sp. CGMCC 1.13656]MVQ47915.1 hypothetical protein [Nocardioides sp. MAH-18]